MLYRDSKGVFSEKPGPMFNHVQVSRVADKSFPKTLNPNFVGFRVQGLRVRCWGLTVEVLGSRALKD